MLIRPAQVADVPVLAGMIRNLSLYHGDVSPMSDAFLQEHAFGSNPYGFFIIAEQNGVPLGFSQYAFRIDYPFAIRNMILHLLYVNEAARGQGAGRQLIAASIRNGLAAGCQKFRINCEKDNTSTLAVYRRFGFKETDSGESIRFDADRALMEKIAAGI